MRARAFVDTNVLVYLHDKADARKQSAAQDVLLDDDLDLVISAQVLSEFFVTVTRKIAEPVPLDDAIRLVSGLSELEVVPLNRNLVVDATRTAREFQLSYWDALIIEAAAQSGAGVLLSEDLNAGSTLRDVTIENPFAAP